MVTAVQTLSAEEVKRAVQAALAEDVRTGDVTTLATIPVESRATAFMVAREALTVTGSLFARATFAQLSAEVEVVELRQDGGRVESGEKIMKIAGPTRAILTGERVALNFVQRLSGVATLTRKFVE